MIVSNSSCLIILDKLKKLDLLEKLYGKITIPGAVEDGVFKSKNLPSWIEVARIRQPVASRILEKTLGRGEAEAIALSLERHADLLILDDLAARKMAQKMELNVTGVIGILLEAKKLGFMVKIRESLDEMMRYDFRVSKAVYEEALTLAKEK